MGMRLVTKSKMSGRALMTRQLNLNVTFYSTVYSSELKAKSHYTNSYHRDV